MVMAMDMVMYMVDTMEREKHMVMDMDISMVDITEREKLMDMDMGMVDTMVGILESAKLMVMDMVDTMVEMVMVKGQHPVKTHLTTSSPHLRDICGTWRNIMSRM